MASGSFFMTELSFGPLTADACGVSGTGFEHLDRSSGTSFWIDSRFKGRNLGMLYVAGTDLQTRNVRMARIKCVNMPVPLTDP
jgi:hypothetical protein